MMHAGHCAGSGEFDLLQGSIFSEEAKILRLGAVTGIEMGKE
jgi:hypothetical protein